MAKARAEVPETIDPRLSKVAEMVLSIRQDGGYCESGFLGRVRRLGLDDLFETTPDEETTNGYITVRIPVRFGGFTQDSLYHAARRDETGDGTGAGAIYNGYALAPLNDLAQSLSDQIVPAFVAHASSALGTEVTADVHQSDPSYGSPNIVVSGIRTVNTGGQLRAKRPTPDSSNNDTGSAPSATEEG